MHRIKYNQDGWVCDRFPYNLNDYFGEIEVENSEYEKTMYSELYHAWRVVDGELVQQQYEEKQWTVEERLQERTKLHTQTDNDYAKYSRQVRLGIDIEHSQHILDYIDQYNYQVSDTVNQEGFPQTVTYPEYILP